MKKIILFLNLFLVFNLGFSAPQSNTTGGYIDNKWYAWYDNTFLGKETVISEKFHKFKSLEVDVIGIGLYYDVKNKYYNSNDKFENGFNKVFLKVSNFKLTDINGNIYTKDNYPNEKREEFIPDIIINNRYLARNLLNNDVNLKFKSPEKKDKNLISLDVVPVKLKFVSDGVDIICSEIDGRTLHLSCNDIEYNWYNISPIEQTIDNWIKE